jgi:hypothetical protein
VPIRPRFGSEFRRFGFEPKLFLGRLKVPAQEDPTMDPWLFGLTEKPVGLAMWLG